MWVVTKRKNSFRVEDGIRDCANEPMRHHMVCYAFSHDIERGVPLCLYRTSPTVQHRLCHRMRPPVYNILIVHDWERTTTLQPRTLHSYRGVCRLSLSHYSLQYVKVSYFSPDSTNMPELVVAATIGGHVAVDGLGLRLLIWPCRCIRSILKYGCLHNDVRKSSIWMYSLIIMNTWTQICYI